MTAESIAARPLELVELIAQPAPRRARLRPWIIFAFVVIVAFFGLIFSRVSLDRSGFVLDELDAQIAIEEARHWDLRVEVARLQDPDRITAIAVANGLVYPEERIEIRVPGIDVEQTDPEVRWAQLKAVLTAQP